MAECNQQLLNSSLLKSLECVKCHQIIEPPIAQCVQGHSMCKACVSQSTSCPSCQSGLCGTRNFLVEELLQLIARPCHFSKAGCQVQAVPSELSRHEKLCSFRPYQCPVGERRSCKWIGPKDKILQHCQDKHKQSIWYGGARYMNLENLSFATRQYSCYLIVFDDELFWYYFIVDPKCKSLFFCVQFLGSKERALSYKYCLEFVSSNNVQRLTYSNLTHSDDLKIETITESRICLEVSEGFAECFTYKNQFSFDFMIENVDSDSKDIEATKVGSWF